MTVLYIILLAFIQGITEFLPISSSAHLLIFPRIFNIEDQGVIIDIAGHIGSLFAVLYFYRQDFSLILKNFFKGGDNSFLLKLVLATFPTVVVGAILVLFNIEFRNPKVVIYTSIIFGLLFYLADRFGKNRNGMEKLTVKEAFYIGMAQILAIIPGVSRSGITLTEGMYLGLKRDVALKFSFLLLVPTIILVGLGGVYKFIKSPESIDILPIVLMAFFSFIFSLFVIKFVLYFVKKCSFKIFALYRVALGIFLYFYLK